MTSTGEQTEIRVALVGYGLAGAIFHAPFIAATPGLRLHAIVTSGHAGEAARDFPGARIVPTAEALWHMAGDFDLVVVASPNRTHVPVTKGALDAGAHVVVDKPLAVTTSQVRELMAWARTRGRLLTVFHNRRWDGDFLTLRRLIESGALGHVFRFESRFERWRPEPKAGWRELGDPEEGGGVLLDLGPHLIDQALQLFGPAIEVRAEIDRRRPGVLVDDDVFVAIEHASGVRSHLWMNAVAGHLGPRFRVLGSRAAYVKWGLDPQEEMLRAGRRPDDPGYGDEAMAAWGRLSAGSQEEPVPTENGNYRRFYEQLVDAIRTGRPVPVDPADALVTLEIIERALASAAPR